MQRLAGHLEVPNSKDVGALAAKLAIHCADNPVNAVGWGLDIIGVAGVATGHPVLAVASVKELVHREAHQMLLKAVTSALSIHPEDDQPGSAPETTSRPSESWSVMPPNPGCAASRRQRQWLRTRADRWAGPDLGGHALGSRASSGVTGPTGVAQVDAVAAHGDMFLAESLELWAAFGDRAVGAYDSVPRHVVGRGGKHLANEAWRSRVDVAVGLDEAFGDGSDAGEDLGGAGLGVRHAIGIGRGYLLFEVGPPT